MTAQVEAPDPYIGFGFNPFPHEFGYEPQTEEEIEAGDEPVRVTRRRKFFQIGAPFSIRQLKWDGVDHLKLVFSPEFSTDLNIVIFQGLFVLEQVLPWRSYRSIPSGIVWGLGLGGHFGWMLDTKDYADENGLALDEADKLSLAGVIKGYVGPTFFLNDKMDLRLRFGLDLPFGLIGPYTTNTNSKHLGIMLFIQTQLAFK